MNTRLIDLMRAEERRADKVQELNALLQDPDIADYVEKLLGEQSVPHRAAVPAGNGNGNSQKLQNLTLTPAIRFISPSLPSRFTVDDIAKKMQEDGFDFGGREPRIAVRDAVYVLCRGENPIFRVATVGTGGKPNIYEKA